MLKWTVCGLLIALAIGVLWWRIALSNSTAPASIVLLLKHPKPLNAETLARVLTEVTGRNVMSLALNGSAEVHDTQPVDDIVVGESPVFVVKLNGIEYHVLNHPGPYMDDPARASESVLDLRLKKAIQDHRAWLSMDITGPNSATPAAYRVAALTLARLIDDSCLALFHPATNRLVPFMPDETVVGLNSADPLAAVFSAPIHTPVIPIDDDDPRLKAAVAEARRELPEFEEAFQKKDGAGFFIKAPIERNGVTEHIWVEVDRLSPAAIEGRLANDPVDLTGLKLGSKVDVRKDQIEDWMYMREDRPIGGFTVAVVRQIREEKSSAK